MRFKANSKGTEVIWNKEAGQPLIQSFRGVFETEDPKVIETLKKLKYKEIKEEKK